MSNENYKIPHGKLSLDISSSHGFRGLQLIYDDHVYSLTRAELIGKTREELMKEIDFKLKKTKEFRETFTRVLNSVKSENGEAAYNALIEELKHNDPEICELCGIE